MKRALLALWLAGCPATKVAPPPPPAPTFEPERPMALDELREDLEKTIRESYQALSKGFDESYLEFLAHDQRLVLIDVGPEDVLVGYADRAVQQTRQLADRGQTVVSKRLEVHVSPDGTAAWSFDELSYRVLHEGRRVIIPMRATAVYERRAGRWLLVQQHVSYAIPDDEVWDYAASGRIGKLAALADFVAPDASSKAAAGVVTRLLAGETGGVIDERALVIGSDPDAEFRAGEAVAHASFAGIYGAGSTVRVEDVRVKASATGQLAWAAAEVRLAGTWEGRAVELPLRVTYVLERKPKATFRVVQMHVSAPVGSDELSLRALGVVLI